MSRVLKISIITISSVLRLAYFVLAIVLIGSGAYIFGYIILHNPIMGNDGAFALSYAVWIDKYFPNIPFWYPLQGAGISMVTAYPQFFFVISEILHKWTGLTLIQSMGAVQFSTLVLTSLGIYLYVWIRFRNQTMAVIASLLYFLSPMTYVWIIGAGFFAQTFSFIFVPYALLFFDLYLDASLKNKKGLIKRFYFTGSVAFICLAMLGHPATGIGMLIIFGLYAVLYPLFIKEGRRIDNLKRGMIAVFWVELTSLLLVLFWLLPLQIYQGHASRGINPSPKADLSTVARFNLKGTLGLPIDYEYTNFNMAPAVWVLGIFAGIFGFFYNRKALVLFLLAVLVIYLTGSFQLYTFIFPLLHDKSAYLTSRFYTGFTLVLIPILGAYGAYSIARTLFLLPKIVTDRLVKFIIVKSAVYQFGHMAAAVVSVVLIAVVVYQLRNIYSGDKSRFHYGPENGGYSKRIGHSIYNIWDYRECDPNLEGTVNCPFPKGASLHEQLKPANWPVLKLGDIPDGGARSVYGEGGIMEKVPQDPFTRIDITPNLGSQTKNWPIYSDVSIINTYNFQASLVHAMWGYEQGVFFSNVGLFEKPILVNELGKYFGTDYLVLNPGSDPIDKFRKAGWEKYADGKPNYGYEVWKPQKSTGLYSLITQPKILFIGSLKLGAYEQLFRLANLGAIPYDRAFFAEGESENIDDYSLDKLKGFDLVFLHGYTYKNKKKAWALLDKYVSGGGSVFVDNGWQFIGRDWGKGPDEKGKIYPAQLPEPVPVTESMWGRIGSSWDGFELNKEIASGVELSKVDPPTYVDQGWSGSYSDKEELRDGAIPVLFNKDGKVLIGARKAGGGKIVWSGMNIVGFAGGKKGEESIKLVNALVTWLVGEGGVDEAENDRSIEVKRPWPDKIEFTFKKDFENKGFVFREAYYPGWKATLISAGKKETLPMYRGGVGFMYVNIPKIMEGEIIVFEYKTPISVIFSRVISVLTLIVILIYLMGKLKIDFLLRRVPSLPRSRLKFKNILEEED